MRIGSGKVPPIPIFGGDSGCGGDFGPIPLQGNAFLRPHLSRRQSPPRQRWGRCERRSHPLSNLLAPRQSPARSPPSPRPGDRSGERISQRPAPGARP